MAQRLTLETIAERAGVSRSTVSRVLNDEPNVNPQTRANVHAVMQKLNYHPNAAARGLASGRTHILGLVIPMGVSALFTDPYFPLLMQGISAKCNQQNYSTMLWLAEPEYERRMIRQILSAGLIDGVIVASALVDDPVLEALAQSDLPFILVGRYPRNRSVSYVDVDNVASARDAVKHLLALGKRRIATIAGPRTLIAGRDRLKGYKDAIKISGTDLDPELIVESDFTQDGGYTSMRQLLPRAPDAVFVASDAMAIGALRALRELGKRVPDDIALVAFDDIPIAARAEPPLTTVRQPILQMGMAAAETLMDLIAHPNHAPRHVLLPTELVIRESSGAALVN